VRSLSASAGGLVSIEFAHMCAFFPLAGERYTVRAYETKLEFRDLAALSLAGSWRTDDYVSDATLNGAPIDSAATEALFRGIGPATLSVRFASGSSLVITGAGVQLHLGRELRQMKDWVGPLHGPP
jgi:hypothetical protein